MQPQRFGLIRGQLEHEILREASWIAADLLVEAFGRDAVKSREVNIKHDFVAADQIDAALDLYYRNYGFHWGPLYIRMNPAFCFLPILLSSPGRRESYR